MMLQEEGLDAYMNEKDKERERSLAIRQLPCQAQDTTAAKMQYSAHQGWGSFIVWHLV